MSNVAGTQSRMRPGENRCYFVHDILTVFLEYVLLCFLIFSMKHIPCDPVDTMATMLRVMRLLLLWTIDGPVFWRIHNPVGLAELTTRVVWILAMLPYCYERARPGQYVYIDGMAVSAVYSICSVSLGLDVKRLGPRLNINVSIYRYRNFVCKDQTVIRPSYLYNGSTILRKKAFLLRRGPEMLCSSVPGYAVLLGYMIQMQA